MKLMPKKGYRDSQKIKCTDAHIGSEATERDDGLKDTLGL
jgi:hypothetical protein